MLKLVSGEENIREKGYRLFKLPFLFDFGDLGNVDGEIHVSLFNFSNGTQGFIVKDVNFEHPVIKSDPDRFAEIFNDNTTQSHKDLKQRLFNMGVIRG